MNFIVRNAVASDSESFTRVVWDGVKFWAGDSLPELRQWYDENYTLELLENKILSGGCFVAISSITGLVGGTVMVSKIVMVDGVLTAEMKSLYTDVKGNGVGSLLVNSVIDVCRAVVLCYCCQV